ncbi:MAG: hypothetical protein WC966_00795 [Bradymonadales bacterium]
MAPAEGVAQDHPQNALKVASCAMDRRLADTAHKIMRLLAYFEGSLRVGGHFPHKSKWYTYRINRSLRRVKNCVGMLKHLA